MFRRIVVGFIILATLLGAAKVDPESLPHVRAAPQQGTVVTGIPAFFDLAVDDAHGRLFGTEKAAGRVVVLGLPNLNTITTISLGQASSPSGLSLSSDGTQLAVALFGFGSIALIDTATLTVTDHLYPNVTVGASYPYDVRYGVAGRLYSVGNPNSGRLDYVHAFDTATGEEIGASSTVVRGGPRLAITADKSTLYVSEPDFSPQQVYRFAVTSNTPTKTGQGPHGPVIASTIAARSDGNALFTSYGQVWSGDLTQKIGAFEAFGGNIEYIPALDRLYVSQGATVVEIDAQAPYDVLARRPVAGVAGVARANAAGTRLYVSTNVGMEVIRLDAPTHDLTVQYAGSGLGSVLGGGIYTEGDVATLTAAPSLNNYLFVGWRIDGVYAGWANPLTVTMSTGHVIQATFSQVVSFSDSHPTPPDFNPITELATRGTIRGYATGTFGPGDGVQRAQMAALIARAMPAGPGTPPTMLQPPACVVSGSWDCEDWGNSFKDQSGAPGLWRDVGTLRHYNVAFGYGGDACEERGVSSPCFAPNEPVSYAQTISFITRAMIAKGYWVAQPNAPQPYPNVPSTHAGDFRTFNLYTAARGGIPSPPANWNAGALRGWFALALWAALDSYWGTDTLMPDGRASGGYRP